MPKKKLPSKKCARDFCNSWAMQGGLFCRKHCQYDQKRGVLAANLSRGGRYSASLPKNLVGRYEDSRRDPHLLELRDEISVVVARSQQIQEKLNTFESGKAWQEIKKTVADLKEAMDKVDPRAVHLAMDELSSLVSQGCGEYAIWQEQERLFALHMKLVESERKRLLELKRYLELERLMVLVDSLAAAVHEEVEEQDTREAIAKKMATILANSHVNPTVEAKAEVLDDLYQAQMENSGVF